MLTCDRISKYPVLTTDLTILAINLFQQLSALITDRHLQPVVTTYMPNKQVNSTQT